MLLYNGKRRVDFSDCGKTLNRVWRDDNFTFAKYTTYGVGGGAKSAYFPRNLLEARAVYDKLEDSDENFFILADGSNVLAADSGFDGSVICTRNLCGIARMDKGTIFCLSGTPVGCILKYCKQKSLGGLEYLAGIPASIGGLVYMNGGAGGRYISSNVLAVKIYRGKDYNLTNSNCNFTYKHSTMRNIKCLILGVFLSVFEDSSIDITKKINERLALRKKLPSGRSCGCVFKNLDGVSAGRLIEECGLAGYGTARAFVSRKHCNFIINNGASAGEIKLLIDKVKAVVFQKRNICLEEEVIYVGSF